MYIRVLGTRGKIPQSAPRHQNHSGILIDEKVMIDIGEPDYLNLDPQGIVFTHFHPDHAYFVLKQENFTPDIPLFGPQQHELIPRLQVISGPFTIGSYHFTPIPVIHALHLKSFGYLVEKGDECILITGDVAWIEKPVLENLPQLDLIITEATYIQKGGIIRRKKDRIFGHTGVPDLIRLLSPYTSRMVFTHFGSWYFKNPEDSHQKLKALEPQGTQLIPAYDGMKIRI